MCVPNKTEDLNLSAFNMIAGINESETLTKHISCKCRCGFDGRNCNNKCRCKVKKHDLCEDYICNPATCSSKNSKYSASIIEDSIITCDEITEITKSGPTNFNEKKCNLWNKKLLYFTSPFINHYSIIDRC